MLCRGGPVKYKLKAGHANLVTDDWLFTNCVPHICLRFPNDRRLCRILDLSTMYACCDPTLRETLPEAQRMRSAAALQGIDYGLESTQWRRPPYMSTHSVNGNLCIDEMTHAMGKLLVSPLLLVLLLMVQFYRASFSISNGPTVPRPSCRCRLTRGLLP